MRFPVALANPIPLYLAPMAGVSESPFRRLCRRFGADVVVTEFLSAEGIRRENEATIAKLRFGPDEHPIGVQIFGSDPIAMGDAAALVTDVFAPDFIDINFGCPVKKVVKRNGGSGCLKDLTLVADIIKGVRARTHLPVTAKIRSGWNEETRDPVKIARVCEDAGAAVIALHARARTQMYSGKANWDEIAAVVNAVSVPVLGNGDISSAADVFRMHEHTNCAGVMVERFAIALDHARMADAYELDQRGAAIEFRKHLGWYVKGLPGSAELRKRLHAVTSLMEVEGIFADYLAAVARGDVDQRRASERDAETLAA